MKNKVKSTKLLLLVLIVGLSFTQLDLRGQGTGGTLTTSGIRKIHTFSTSGSITPVAGLDSVGLSAMYYTIVGGGGGGATGTSPIGGGGGEVVNLNAPGVNYRSTQSITVTIGAGGAAGATGNPSSISFTNSGGAAVSLAANGGNSNGSTLAMGSSRASDTTSPVTFGPGTSVTTSGSYGYGGGAGNSSLGGNGTSNTGGNGGRGRSVLNAENVRVTYGGGGGGCGKNTLGSGGSGGGGAARSTANTNGISGTVNSGGGGGAADGGGSAVGGSGGSGVVIVSYEGFDYFSGTAPGAWTYLNAPTNTHTAGAAVKFFTSTTLGASSWGSDDIYVKSGVTLTVNGAVTCRNLYCDGSIVLAAGGSITVNNTFFANASQTLPTTATIKNLQILGASNTTTLGGNTTLTGILTLASGNKLDISSFTLSVNAFSGTGTIKGGSSSRIYITGPTAGTFYMDQTTDLTTNRLKYLGLASSATATLGNRLVVYGDTSYSGVVDLRTSSVLTTNTTSTDAARLVFKYNITDDRHGNIGYNGGSISGEAMVEDYFPAATVRGYRQLGHTLDSSMSLNQLTDDLDLYGTMGSGIASGRGASGNRDGLIAATATAKNSIFLYDEKSSSGSKWIPFTTSSSTNNVIPFATGAMYVMRPSGTGEAGSYNAQLIDFEGQLVFGSKSVTCKLNSSLTTPGFNLLANPYQTCLNFDEFLSTNNNKLTTTGFKKYNKETKNYIDHTKSGSTWVKGGTTITKPNLHPGDAFWVQVKTDGVVLNFTEAMTTNDPVSDVSKGNKMEVDSTLYNTLLMKLSSSQDSTIGDEIVLLNASWGKSLSFSNGDMYNANGTCIDLSVEGADQEKISFKTLPIANDCIIPCFVTACASGAYTFNFDINYNKPVEAITYRLLDKFTGKQQDIKSGDKYKFNIDLNDIRSFGSGRFYINCIANTLNNENIDKATSEYSIYPNPISKNGALTIARNSGSSKVGTVTLVNQLGQAIYKNQITNDMGLDILDLSGLEIQPGIYFLQLTGTNGTETIKLVIK